MGTALSITAPELSALRALVRALRRSGLREEAIAFGTRAVERAGDARELFGWMAALLQLEVGLADGDAETTKAAQERLHRTHPEATRFHARLLSSEGNEREAELDRVWY